MGRWIDAPNDLVQLHGVPLNYTVRKTLRYVIGACDGHHMASILNNVWMLLPYMSVKCNYSMPAYPLAAMCRRSLTLGVEMPAYFQRRERHLLHVAGYGLGLTPAGIGPVGDHANPDSPIPASKEVPVRVSWGRGREA